MSYIRGKYYTWRGQYDDGSEYMSLGVDEKGNMPMEVFDEIVVMRYAELKEEGKTNKIEKRVMETNSGNVGSWALLKQYGAINMTTDAKTKKWQKVKQNIERVFEEVGYKNVEKETLKLKKMALSLFCSSNPKIQQEMCQYLFGSKALFFDKRKKLPGELKNLSQDQLKVFLFDFQK